MRPLKFRLWDREEHQMFWLDLTWGNHHSAGQGWLMAVPWGEEYIHGDGFRPDNRKCLNPEDCEFMQFTGLFDRTGKEIWEGDVVQCKGFTGPALVSWSDDMSGFVLGGWDRRAWEPNECDVIGNIYENPELLK